MSYTTSHIHSPGICGIDYFEDSTNSYILTAGSDGIVRKFKADKPEDESTEVFQITNMQFQTIAVSQMVIIFLIFFWKNI